jgi:rhodanese-related sulfurtransferase
MFTWFLNASENRRSLMLALLIPLALVSFAAPAGAGNHGLIKADAAFALSSAGAMTIIDVRSPSEWQQTGVPKGARRVTIHDPGGIEGFVAAVIIATGNDLDRPVALICARGNRSARAQKALRDAGFKRALNIGEGMFGSNYGKGWLKRGLPVER